MAEESQNNELSNIQQYSSAEQFAKNSDADVLKDASKIKKNRRRRAITKNMKLKTDGVTPPGLKLPEGQVQQGYTKPAGEKQVVNVVSLLINEQLGAALERFNICACPKCCHIITQRVMAEVEPVFVHVSTVDDAHEVNIKLSEIRPDVTRVITKTVMAGRIKPYHKQ